MTHLGSFGAKNLILTDSVLRYCLTCKTCQEFCPQNVEFIEFIKVARKLLVERGIEIEEPHDGILTIITKIQAKSKNGMKIPSDIVPKGYEVSKKGKIAYFIGCLPILDVAFENIETNSSEIARNGIKILNKVLEEPPVLIENAKCCGHDALWKGYSEVFKKLAEHNVKEFKKLGIKTIITTCAECYRTLKLDYPKYVKSDFEVIHLSELIASKIKEGKLKFPESNDSKVTYHDPCRLGRHMEVYGPPREILNSMKENKITFKEMERNSENAACCGVSCFANCNDYARAMQVDRLTEAKGVADILVTTCPKCQVHFKCMQQEKKEDPSDIIDLEVTDLTNLIASVMGLSENTSGGKNK